MFSTGKNQCTVKQRLSEKCASVPELPRQNFEASPGGFRIGNHPCACIQEQLLSAIKSPASSHKRQGLFVAKISGLHILLNAVLSAELREESAFRSSRNDCVLFD